MQHNYCDANPVCYMITCKCLLLIVIRALVPPDINSARLVNYILERVCAEGACIWVAWQLKGHFVCDDSSMEIVLCL